MGWFFRSISETADLGIQYTALIGSVSAYIVHFSLRGNIKPVAQPCLNLCTAALWEIFYIQYLFFIVVILVILVNGHCGYFSLVDQMAGGF